MVFWEILQHANHREFWRSKEASFKLSAAILLTLVASDGMAQEHPHGSGEKLGAVHFATSCNEAAQAEFNRAVALLHSFQFSSAIEGFNAVLLKDSTCGIAYWGIELSDWSNPFAPEAMGQSQMRAGGERGRGTIVGCTNAARTSLSRGSP